MRLDGGLGQLTYCSNIHPGETWPEVLDGLRRHLPTVKAAVAPAAPLGLGLRLSAAAAEALIQPAALEELQALLDEGPYYVFTLNGFPYGTFHGASVKEGAYRPDWSEEERLLYSNRLAEILAIFLPEGLEGSVSTVPGTFKPWAEGRVEAITENLIRHVAELVAIEDRRGRHIVLALEPEPCCFLETIAETVDYFEGRLFSAAAAARLAALSGLSEPQAEAALRRHLGVCYDVCHAAVEFEDPRDSLARLRAAGIRIAKLQLSAALRIPSVGAETRDQLAPFAEPVYLHQTVERGPEGLTRYLDLPEALAQAEGAGGREWRIHFHVPIFLEAMQDFGTTQAFLREILALHRAEPVTDQLEVETYTWDVLPERYRQAEVGTAIARELNWVREQLA
ncbi:MAG: metabolite traffic protein EboE [Kiloniellales bacterium]|nr:metabolite traffic protein EboE [Kiloniellales bacterium]